MLVYCRGYSVLLCLFLTLSFSLSLNDQDVLLDQEPIKRKPTCCPSQSSTSSLLPPLKSARYCKKQRQRNGKTRALSPSIMLMYESATNHHRVSSVLNELSNGTCNSLLFESLNNNQRSSFWSRKRANHCQEFWDEYLECDEEFSKISQDFSLLSLSSNLDESCPRACYTKITKSIRKLLKRTFTGAPTFAELENLVKSLLLNRQDSSLTFSCGQVLNLSSLGATIKLDTPFHRVWLHAICQYHGISSQSKTVQDDRLVFINFRLKHAVESPKINLYNFLLQF